MQKEHAIYVAGVYEMGQVGTSTRDGASYNQASSKPDRINMLVELTGLGSCVTFTTRNDKQMYGWQLSSDEEYDLLKEIRPHFHVPGKIQQADKWIDMVNNLRGTKPAAKKPVARRKTASKKG